MKQISIATLERLADVKAHTFRAWEQRYNFLKPRRTATNYRYYTIHDLGELLNIALLNKCGYKVSHLNKMDSNTIRKIIEELSDDEGRKVREINKLIVFMFSENIEAFEETLDNCVYYWGNDRTIEDIIIPFLDHIQLLSYKDSSNEVHFVVTAIRKKIISGIENAKPILKVDRKALFFLPQHEHFDLILLYLTYLVKREGFRIFYLGTNIPLENLENVIAEKKPELIFTYFTSKNRFQVQNFAQHLDQHFPGSSLIISGITAKSFELSQPKNVKFIEHNEMKMFLSNLPESNCSCNSDISINTNEYK